MKKQNKIIIICFIPIISIFLVVNSLFVEYNYDVCERYPNSTSWKCNVKPPSDGMVDYGNYAGLNLGKIYNPTFVTDLAWFNENREDHGEYYLIPYNYNWVLFKENKIVGFVDKPFYSCEGNGKGIALNMDEHKKTDDKYYLDEAYKYYYGLTNSFLHDGDYWIHGFYHKDIGGTYILNSQMYCLANIYGLYEHTNDPEIKEFFDNGVKRLEMDIESYLVDGGTIYSKYSNTFKPHKGHPDYVNLVKIFYEWSDSEKLKSVYNKMAKDYNESTNTLEFELI